MTSLRELFDDYESGTVRNFPKFCIERGWRVVLSRGCYLAYDGERLVAAALVAPQDASPRPLSTVPCAKCGSLPIGEYSIGETADDRRRFGCGPHEPSTP